MPTSFPAYAGHLVIALGRALRARTAEMLQPLSLEPGHIGVLAALAESKGASQRELGRLLRTDRTTVVRLIDELETRNAVKRREGEDRRINAVRLTEAGRKLAKEADTAVRAAQAEVLKGLTPAKQRQLVALLREAHDSLPPFAG